MERASKSDLHQNGSGRTSADGEMTTKKADDDNGDLSSMCAVVQRCLNALLTKRGEC